MHVQFANTIYDKRTLIKQSTPIGGVYECILKDNTTILNPTLILQYSEEVVSRANYVYINELKRWYYTGDIVLMTGGEMLVPCEVDVLMSWAGYIKGINTAIRRQEFINSPMVADNEYILRNDRYIDRYVIGTAIRSKGYYITVNGGNLDE